MRDFEVKRSRKRTVHATIVLDFDPLWVCCSACHFLETYSQNKCRLTGLKIHDTSLVDFNCPLDFWIEEEDESGKLLSDIECD